ncbi:MAG TPA: allantoate amidohydrolase [Acidimicrobiia bacterium]|nr:allantoate amidohydrolase [Acidimicrobiia bacterium]
MSVNELLARLAPIGLDPATGGYRRFSWTPVDSQLRAWFVDQARSRRLLVEKDRNANLWAFLGDARDGEVVAVGSHLDSVPDGGAFDGPLGIASAFAALDLLAQRGLRPQRPIAVVAFTEEEGARFGVACLGSRLLTGAVDPERARKLTDASGVSLEEAMAGAGEDPSRLGAEPSLLARLGSYVELHIEQGRGLIDLGHPVAIGSEIWPHGRWRLDFRGTANHAGTTRMQDRDDPMARFAATVVRVLDSARSADTRATFGRIEVAPNSTNAIPARVTAWLDARAASDGDLASIVASAGEVSIAAESVTRRVEFDPDLRDRLAGLLGGVPVLPTAAGHDAGVLSEAGVPTAMLFVRNPTGVSHSPAEHATAADCVVGTESLARVLTDLGGFH